MKNITKKIGVPLMAVLVAASVQAQQYVGDTVNMSLNATFPYAESGISASLNGAPIITSGDLIGLYGFTINAVTPDNITIASPFYSTCVSPNGALNFGAYNYTLETFAQANPGINPGSWATGGGGQLYGIQNANFLFTQLAANLYGTPHTDGQSGTAADQAAAMALAMYAALYNSTGYGSLGNTGFQVTGASSAVSADYLADMNLLKSFSGSGTLPAGYVLNPTVGTSQDLILGTGIPNLISTVPEPTTIIAGALLLLPLGASTLSPDISQPRS